MKRLSFRFCRRALLILAILFPIVYLCGGLFLGLAGAHGEQMFAEPIYTEQYVEVGEYFEDGKMTKLVFDGDIKTFAMENYPHRAVQVLCDYTFNDTAYTYFLYGVYNNQSWYLKISSPEFWYYFPATQDEYLLFSMPWVFYSESFPKSFVDFFSPILKIYKLMSVPTEVVPENNSAYTDFIFSQPFAKDNFISNLGRGVLDDTAFGFPPFRDMFNWFNDSVMHIESDDDLGVFGLGYAYYAMNVVAVYELVVLVLMVFALPLRITDRFMGEHL